jgi:hypothetical protein
MFALGKLRFWVDATPGDCHCNCIRSNHITRICWRFAVDLLATANLQQVYSKSTANPFDVVWPIVKHSLVVCWGWWLSTSSAVIRRTWLYYNINGVELSVIIRTVCLSAVLTFNLTSITWKTTASRTKHCLFVLQTEGTGATESEFLLSYWFEQEPVLRTNSLSISRLVRVDQQTATVVWTQL